MTGLSVIGVPSSAGSYAAGQDQAPAALRVAGLIEALTDAGLAVRDHGDLPEQIWRPDRQQPFAQNAGQVTTCLQELPAAAAARPGSVPGRRSRPGHRVGTRAGRAAR